MVGGGNPYGEHVSGLNTSGKSGRIYQGFLKQEADGLIQVDKNLLFFSNPVIYFAD